MVVAAIPLRDAALQIEPSWGVIIAGILFHQWADFSWAVVFFGLFGRWTAGLRPWTILAVAIPWAVFTSSLEWLFLVPLIPFRQPLFTLEQPYWIGFTVHATSASMYPLFPWLRDWLAGDQPSPHRRFALIWSGLAAFGVAVFAALAFLGWQDRELPHAGGNLAFDQGYMRRMAAHHAQGVDLARLAVERAQASHLRPVARLMVAAQQGEIAIFNQWWRSWFGGSLPPALPQDHATMPGMIAPEAVERLRRTEGPAFDGLFVELMTAHHQGAIAMASDAIQEAGDVRLKLMSHAIRHAQRGEIELMRGTKGLQAVKAGVWAFLAPAGQRRAGREDQGARQGH